MALETRRIGTTDIEVSILGFGGAPLGFGGGAPLGSEALSDSQAVAIAERAYQGGVRYFDTAPLYGHGDSERRIGAVLSQRPRDEFILSTKVGRLLVPAGNGQPPSSAPLIPHYDYSYPAARQSLEESLVRLGLDRVDIALCHDVDTWTQGDAQPDIFEVAARGALPALNDLRSEGVIRAFGLGVNESRVCNQVLDLFDVDCFLLAGRFTLLEQDPLDDLLPRCLDRDVSIIVGGPYNSGMLATDRRERAMYDYRPVDDERWARAQEIRRICDEHGTDIRAAALQYPLQHPAVASVIPGSASLKEVEANFVLMEAPVPAGLWLDLDAAGLVRSLT